MSSADLPPTEPTPPDRPSGPASRHGCLTALMVIIGIVLLLPGVCAIIFGVASVGSSSPDPTVTLLVLLGLAVGAGGILLIRAAIRGPQR